MEKIKFRSPKRWIFWMAGSLVFISIVVAISVAVATSDEDGGGVRLKAVKPKSTSVVGGDAATKEYTTKLEKQNELFADEAKTTGKSYVPTVIGKSKPVVIKKEEPEPVPVVKRPEPRPVKPAVKQKTRKKSTKSMARYKRMVMMDINKVMGTKTDHRTVKSVVFREQDNSFMSEKNVNASSANFNEKILPPLPFAPGDMLYATNIIKLNSDVPSPVVVEVVSGEGKGIKLFGKFSRHYKHMLLKFDKLRTRQGLIYGVDAVALDPETLSAAVRSDVDSHYMERWGGLIAASFLEGAGEALSRSGTTIERIDRDYVFSYPEYTTEELAWQAAGKVGQRLADQLEKGFDRAPTVYEDSGAMIGVMILSIKGANNG